MASFFLGHIRGATRSGSEAAWSGVAPVETKTEVDRRGIAVYVLFSFFLMGLLSADSRERIGFTLIEVMSVIAVIAVLATLTFSAAEGIREKAIRDSARAEMDIIEQALEAYKGRFGDYPKSAYPSDSTLPEVLLFNSLLGKLSPAGGAINMKPMLNYSVLTLDNATLPNPGNTTSVTNHILDPWGRAYVYRYNPAAPAWESYSYLLYSAGPDGLSTIPADGIKNPGDANNLDNLYAR